MEQVFTNFRLILEGEELSGTLVVRDGYIADIQPGNVSSGENGNGAYLLPGLVELHTDHLEACLAPRPSVRWPLDSALEWYDRTLLAAGITTACAAIALRDVPGQPMDRGAISETIAAFTEGITQGTLQVDHRLNLRCELATQTAAEALADHLDNPFLAVISLMDHTPGQRQFREVEKFRAYYRNRYRLSENELDQYQQELLSVDRAALTQHQQQIAAMAHSRSLCLSSHDDATPEHIAEAVRDGVTVAEFPTTLEAAQEAHNHGLKILMGAPNVVLNRSHSNNLSAREAAAKGLLDILSSDYAPQSLLSAVFLLRSVGMSLPAAIRTVTTTPAEAISLSESRGSLGIGKRADLLVVQESAGAPHITAVYVAGNRVA